MWYGPHQIIEIINPHKVRIRLLGSDLTEIVIIDRIRFLDGSDVDDILKLQRYADLTRPGDYVLKRILKHEKFRKNAWKFVVEWSDGSITSEPIARLFFDLPHVVEKYLNGITDPQLQSEVKVIQRLIDTSMNRRKNNKL